MPVDLAIWAKDANEQILRRVLTRVEKVIPAADICHKILVDDGSKNGTVGIARSFGWDIYRNPGRGIASAANEALRHVDTEFFVSLEQDLVLAWNWWQKLPKYMVDVNVAVAQGARLRTNPTLHALDEYANNRLDANRIWEFPVSIDNNIYRTKVIRQIGGFPTNTPLCISYMLMRKITDDTPYKWVVDKSIVSEHVRTGIRDDMKHECSRALICAATCPYSENPKVDKHAMRMTLTSPMRAVAIALATCSFGALFLYPADRLLRCIVGPHCRRE